MGEGWEVSEDGREREERERKCQRRWERSQRRWEVSEEMGGIRGDGRELGGVRRWERAGWERAGRCQSSSMEFQRRVWRNRQAWSDRLLD